MDHMKPRRLKIVEPAFAGYTGPLGDEEFVDGVSVHLVGFLSAQRLGSNFQMVDADDEDRYVSPVAEMERLRTIPANNVQVLAVGTGVTVGNELVPASVRYTRAELEEMADKRGLTGLREVANPLGVGARAIADLIERILEAQAGAVTEPVVTEPVVAEPVVTEGSTAELELDLDQPAIADAVTALIADQPMEDPSATADQGE